MQPIRHVLAMAALATLAALANPAQAQATIDQAKATTKGIGGGDTAGFPITITQPGSYKLMSNLVIASPTVGAIHVTAPNVTIDLNGFSITGPNTCNPQTKTCTQAYGSVNGIYSEASNTTVMNGSVSGFSFAGISLHSRGSVARNVFVEHNILVGLFVNDGRIESATAQFNGSGMSLYGGVITNSYASNNLANGFNLNGGLLIASSAMSNGAAGVQFSGGGGGIRESFFQYNTGPAINSGGWGASMGNNLCNNLAC
jgi:hypothetical protein